MPFDFFIKKARHKSRLIIEVARNYLSSSLMISTILFHKYRQITDRCAKR